MQLTHPSPNPRPTKEDPLPESVTTPKTLESFLVTSTSPDRGTPPQASPGRNRNHGARIVSQLRFTRQTECHSHCRPKNFQETEP